MADQLSEDLKSLTIDRSAPRGGGNRGWMVWLAALGGIGAAVYFFAIPYFRDRIFKTTVKTAEISVISPAQASTELSSTGYVAAQVTAKVVPQTISRITSLLVREGQEVKVGDPIARLDDAAIQAAIATAQARVAAARARADSARAQLAETRGQAERERSLAERGVTGRAAVEDFDSRLKSLGEQVRAAEAETRAAQAEVAARRVEFNYTVVNAPISGTVITKPLQVGELVGPQLPPILELADTTTLVVETDVSEARLGMVKIGSPSEIILDAYPDRTFEGETIEIGRKMDRAKASATVRVKFTGKTEGVLTDMSARVSFLSAKLDEAQKNQKPKTIVPASAIAERGGRKVVFVVEAGVLQMVPVEIGESMLGGFELKSGPSPGTRVVSDPGAKLSDGQKVKEKSE